MNCFLKILLFFMHISLSANHFDFLQAYSIPKIRNFIKDKINKFQENYTIGVLENSIINNEKIFRLDQVTDLEYTINIQSKKQKEIKKNIKENFSENNEDNNHADMVTAILTGNQYENFTGGVLKDALIIQFIPSYNMIFNENYNPSSDLIVNSLIKLSKNSHIINRSGSLTHHKNNFFEELTSQQIESIKNSFVENDSVLIISASNKDEIFDKLGTSTSPILQLLNDKEMEKRILIVANLEYKDKKTLENEYEINMELIKLSKYFLEKYQNNENIDYKNLYIDFKNYINKNFQDDLECDGIKISDIKEFINDFNGSEAYKNTMNDIIKSIDSSCQKLATSMKQICKISDFLIKDKSYQEEFKAIFNKAQNDLNHLPNKDNFINSGKLRTMIASENTLVQNNFIAAYGTNILSAYDSSNREGFADKKAGFQSFKIDSGSSQATPIVTGIVVLLHQYLNEVEGKKTSFVDVIKLIKENARKVGVNSSFGKGILDTSKLFPKIFEN